MFALLKHKLLPNQEMHQWSLLNLNALLEHGIPCVFIKKIKKIGAYRREKETFFSKIKPVPK